MSNRKKSLIREVQQVLARKKPAADKQTDKNKPDGKKC